jgi:glycosyltransferase involved in cell wall biosynthesis
LRDEAATIYINARLAGRRTTGVERLAAELAPRLLARMRERKQVRALAIAPGNAAQAAYGAIRPRTLSPARSVLWEQVALPWRVRGGFLVNLSNTGPLLLRRQLAVICDAAVFAAPENYSPMFRAWYRIAQTTLLRRAQRVVTISAFSRGELARFCGVPPERLQVVHCGADHLDAVAAEEDFPRRSGLTPGRYVLAVGTPSRAKNLAALYGAMQSLSDLGLELALAGELATQVFRAARSEAPPAARVLGHVSDAQLKSLYAQAFCLAFPSRYEGFGLPPLEAMRCGCPVVAARAAALPETCGDAALYFDPDDPAGLAQRIRSIAASAGLREDLRAQGRTRANRFTWNAAADQLVAIIGDAIAEAA